MTALTRPQRLKVLVVDDDAVARRLIVANLRARYDIIEAGDGLEAVEKFGTWRPDVVVMDVDMPRASGSEAAAAMRLLCGKRYVPILLVSSMDEMSVVVASLSNGADDFLPKPFNPRLFESKLQVFLRLREMQERLVEQNEELSRFRTETEAEQRLAQEVFTRLLQRSAFDDPRVGVATSPLGVLSGDLVAASRLADGRFRWMLADVAGHGLSGALGTLPVVTLFNASCERDESLEVLVQHLNAELKALLPPTLFCAAALLELDAARAQVSVVNAGLPDVLILSPSECRAVPSSALPLGITRGAAFDPRVSSYGVSPGDTVWTMSDGVVEAHAPSGALFGVARVTEALVRRPTVQAALGALQASLEAFTGGTVGDDRSLIGVQV